MNVSNLIVIAFAGLYGLLSKFVFDKVYNTSFLVVDEEFHLPLGEQYCFFHYNKWDPKVTTLPGLYLLSSIILGPFRLCSIYWLRFTSLLFSFVNVYLVNNIFSRHAEKKWRKLFSAISVSLLPPLYFFSHVYYTDVVSLTMNLLLVLLSDRGLHYYASIAGFFSILCRQTNVIFVGLYGGQYVLTELYSTWVHKKGIKKDGKFPSKHFERFILDILKNPTVLLKQMSWNFWLNFFSYASVIIFFITFVLLNGSIVVGDKNAHQITLNIPQIFYFSLFCLIFGWPHFISHVFSFVNFAKRHKLLICFVSLIFAIIIYFNTVIHPYLLADNRHIIFYFWNRFFARFWWCRYALIPVYIFSLYVIGQVILDKTDISFGLLYVPAIFTLLATQSLLELRYFLVPYLLIRFRLQNQSTILKICLEFLTYVIINVLTFNIFFTKVFYWTDMDYPQRIIW